MVVKAMGLGLVTTYSDGSIYLSMFLLKITSYGQKKGYCGSVACPLFWGAVLVSDQWAVFLMSWSLNICSTILTGLRQMFICKVNSVYYLWWIWASIDHRCQKEWLALFASLFRINCNPVFCSIFPLCFEPCVYFWPGVRLFSAASIFCVCWSMCALVTGVCVNGRPFLHILFPPHLNHLLDM